MSDTNQKKMLQNVAENFPEENCINDALLLQFIEGHTGAEETTKIQAHLNECEICAHIVGSVYYNKTHPFTAEEQREAEKLLTLSPEEQVAELLNLSLSAVAKRSHSPRLMRPPDASRKPSLLESLFRQTRLGQLAFAALAVLFMIAGQQGVRYYQTDYQIAQAATLLQKEHRVHFQGVRLSGGYASSGAGTTMGPGNEGTMGEEEKEETYVDRAKAQVERAVSNGAASVKARQLLAQVFLLAQDARVDSLMRELEPRTKESPALANDLGVYYYTRQNWDAAESNFALAQRGDPKLREASFNLALVKAKLGKKEEALALLQEYLRLETDDNWKRAALSLQSKIHQGEE